MPDEFDEEDRPRRRRRDEDDDDDADVRQRRQRRRDEWEDEDATGGLIPYKNKPALIGYYCGFLGLLPLVGLVLAPAAIILGIKGLGRVRAHPHVHGTVHAIVAIVLGTAGFFMCSPFWLLIGWGLFVSK